MSYLDVAVHWRSSFIAALKQRIERVRPKVDRRMYYVEKYSEHLPACRPGLLTEDAACR
jgi:hypothetical protein